jgi:PKD repeat protein
MYKKFVALFTAKFYYSMKYGKATTVNKILQTAVLLLVSVIFFSSCKPDDPTPPPPAANASFTYGSTRVFPVQVQFTNLSTSPFPGASSFLWDFGDGMVLSATTNPLHLYVVAGTYQVKLIQTYSNGTKDTVIKTLQLTTNGPSGVSTGAAGTTAADFSFTIPSGHTVTFVNTSANATSYLWDFGDATNSTSTATTVTHQYNAAGPFNIILRATGAGGTDTCSARIVF